MKRANWLVTALVTLLPLSAWAQEDDGVIHLKPPPSASDDSGTIHLRPPGASKPRAPKPAAKPKTPTTASVQQSAPLSELPSESAARLVGMQPNAAPPKKPAPVKQAIIKPQPHKPTPPPPPESMGFLYGQTPAPARVATAEPGDADIRNMTKRDSLLFAIGKEEPAPSVLDDVRSLSGDLNNALANASTRIQIEAFGGPRGDKSSNARRLSLKRALIVRQLLIDDGVPAERIDVHALGGASDGALDRVDIYIKT